MIKKVFDPEATIKAIHEHRGNLSAVAQAIGFSRQTVYKHIESNPELQAAVEQARTKLDEDIKSVFYDKCLAGDNTCMIFYLKTQCGWAEKSIHQLEGNAEKPVTVKWDTNN